MLALSLGLWWHAGIRTPSRTGFLFGFASVLLSLVEVTGDGFFFLTLMHLSVLYLSVFVLNSLCTIYTFITEETFWILHIRFLFVQHYCSESESLKSF